ncbi:MAG: POTRA domain-containing protein, partial [Prochloraceae cyanobacterium]
MSSLTRFKNIYHFFFLILISLLSAESSFAQIQREPPTLPPPLPERELPPLDTPREPDRQVPRSPFRDTLFVREFNIVGSTIFTKEQLQEVVDPYLDREISFAELIESASRINQLYFDAGYITSGAIVPPQTIRDGIVTIQVIEGSLSEINLTGLDRLDSGY